MRTLGFIAAGIIGLAVVIGLSVGGDLFNLWYQKETAGFRGRSGAEVKLESPAARIQAYNEFFRMCASIQAKEGSIDALQANVGIAEAQKANMMSAHQIARMDLISSYNAKVNSGYTTGRFFDGSLPRQISMDQYKPNSAKTYCGSGSYDGR